jgi:hypothetical protein
VVYESRLELAGLLLADFDPQMEQSYAQPCRLAARIGGRVRHHVPDFLLVSDAGTARLVNVKPAERPRAARCCERFRRSWRADPVTQPCHALAAAVDCRAMAQDGGDGEPEIVRTGAGDRANWP